MKKILINKNKSIKLCIRQISKTGENTLLVVDEQNRLFGSISDGDIRKHVIKKKNLNSKIFSICNQKPFFFFQDKFNKKKIIKIFQKKKYDCVPILDNNKKIIKVIFYRDFAFSKKKETKRIKKLFNVSAVIMAGGLGTRLKPFTNILPKPLIPISGEPIILKILKKLSEFNILKIQMILNYKFNIIKAFVGTKFLKTSINYIKEPKELGTVGGISLLKNRIFKPFFVLNCDNIFNIDFAKVYNFHCNSRFDLTIVATKISYEIPYGVCNLDYSKEKKNELISIQEKPKKIYIVNTGLYVFNPQLINLIKKNTFLNLNEFIELVKNKNKKIGVYLINKKKWIDVGDWENYYKSEKLI